MVLRHGMQSTRDLKKFSWKLIWKIHDLEKTGRMHRIIDKKNADEYYVVICLNHIFRLIESAFEGSELDLAKQKCALVLDKMRRLIEEVESCCRTQSALKKGQIGPLLSMLTDLFNFAIESNLALKINLKEWTAAQTVALVIWGSEL